MNLKKISYLLPLLLLACEEGGHFRESKTFAGGKVVTADTLNLGYTTYQEYCVQCHGVKGDGAGVSSKGMFPPPRNFTLGLYKFGTVPSGDLPRDEDFYRIIRHGLNGTAMLKWDISDKRLDAVTQYIKTFAPAAWEDPSKTLGEPTAFSPNPYEGKEAEGIAYGKEVYHAVANCQSCHSGYATKAELTQWGKKYNSPVTEFEPNLYQVKLQDSDYGYKALPPDFTWHPVRSAYKVDELYLRIGSGINGSGMPAWKGVLEDDQLWAVSYYVKSLIDIRNTPDREVLFSQLNNQK